MRDHTPSVVSSEIDATIAADRTDSHWRRTSSRHPTPWAARPFVIFGPAYTTVDRLIGPDGPREVQAEVRAPDPRRYPTWTSRTHAWPTVPLNGTFQLPVLARARSRAGARNRSRGRPTSPNAPPAHLPTPPTASSPSKASTGQGRALSSACWSTRFRQRGLRVVSTREWGGSPFAEKLHTLILEQGDSESDRRRVAPQFRPAGRCSERAIRRTGSRRRRLLGTLLRPLHVIGQTLRFRVRFPGDRGSGDLAPQTRPARCGGCIREHGKRLHLSTCVLRRRVVHPVWSALLGV